MLRLPRYRTYYLPAVVLLTGEFIAFFDPFLAGILLVTCLIIAVSLAGSASEYDWHACATATLVALVIASSFLFKMQQPLSLEAQGRPSMIATELVLIPEYINS